MNYSNFKGLLQGKNTPLSIIAEATNEILMEVSGCYPGKVFRTTVESGIRWLEVSRLLYKMLYCFGELKLGQELQELRKVVHVVISLQRFVLISNKPHSTCRSGGLINDGVTYEN